MKESIEKLTDSILEVGKGMVKSGTDVRKVEDSLRRMFVSYDIEAVEVFVMSTVEIVTLRDKDQGYHTQIKRIERTRTDLGRYEDFNSLSRYIVEKTPQSQEIDRRIEEIYKDGKNQKIYDIGGHVIGTGAFTIFFGGNVKDGLAASLVGYCIYLMNSYLKREDTNKVIFTLFASMASAFLAILLVRLKLGDNIAKIMIGDIMLFIPGLAILNAIKNMFYGDIISGMFGFIESIIITLAIVAGFALPSYLLGGLI